MLILQMETKSSDLRSEAYGWSLEDSSLVVSGKHIGFTPPAPIGAYTFDCVLRALGAGFKLAGSPVPLKEDGEGEPTWLWHLVRE